MSHLEFVVLGPPLSHQTKNKPALKDWPAKIKAEAAKTWTSPPLTGKLKFVLYNFHEGDEPSVDVDNMVKPIWDALNEFVYADDRQIRMSLTVHVPIGAPIKARGASKIFLDAYSKADEFLYVRVEDAPAVPELPA